MHLRNPLGISTSLVCVSGLFLWALTGCAPPPAAESPLQSFQGKWTGIGEYAGTTITVKGDTLRHVSGADYLWEATIALPAETNPQELHATIIRNSDGTENAGDIAYAILRIEGDTLTLGMDGGASEPPESFEEPTNLAVFKKAKAQDTGCAPDGAAPSAGKQDEGGRR